LNDSIESTPFQAEPAEPPAPEHAEFPWPPLPGSGIFSAFVDTWVASVFRPAPFFAAMPHQGFGPALSYYLPIAVIGSALMLFWRIIAVALGYADLINRFEGQPFDPGAELVAFLLSPLTATLYLVVGAGIVHVGAKMVGAAHAGYMATLRVLAFSAGPELFLAVPLLGVPTSLIWMFVLSVVGIRAVHGTTTGRALAALLLPTFLLLVLAMLVFLAGLFGAMAWGGAF